MDVRYEMACAYLDELCGIGSMPRRTDEEKQEYFNTIKINRNAHWKDICADGKTVGFLIIGTHPNCHPDADYYIEESYIVPEYRKQGHMTRIVSQMLKEKPGVYCLLVLNGNRYALEFWKKRFSENGYVPCELEDVGAADETCVQYGFRCDV